MPHPDDYAFYLECGCRDVSHALGIQKMPEGYALMLDADDMYFFGMEKATGYGVVLDPLQQQNMAQQSRAISLAQAYNYGMRAQSILAARGASSKPAHPCSYCAGSNVDKDGRCSGCGAFR